MERRLGFTILAIDCLLVETLGAFIEGLTDTEGASRATFCGFLTTRRPSKDEFSPDRAKHFYYDFRCGGILHDPGQTNAAVDAKLAAAQAWLAARGAATKVAAPVELAKIEV